MKFSTASAIAVIGAVVPAFVSAADLTVIVGASEDGTAGLVFTPQVTTAAVGDTVNFQFRGGNHTVTQSSFAAPCSWQFNTALNANGFNSGFVPFTAASGEVGVYSLEVTQVDSPIWFFCGRPPHCKEGMFGAINPPTTGERTFDAFTANVQAGDEPGLGTTVPFTPPGANPSGTGSVPAIASGTGSSVAPSGTAPVPGSGAVALSARSAAVLGFVGLAASLVL